MRRTQNKHGPYVLLQLTKAGLVKLQSREDMDISPSLIELCEDQNLVPVPAPDRVRIKSLLNPTANCNWTGDFQYENGNYVNKCVECGSEFIGYKRRRVCRSCYVVAEKQGL
jgi:hypothetical protein